MRIYPVILCGGSGTRLWPASRPSRPKQFLPLLGAHSLFQDTVERLRGLSGDLAPIVVAGESHAETIKAQLAELEVQGLVMVEPEGRDSAPAIAAAAAWIARKDPDGLAVVVASDHHIPDAAAFRESVETAARAASAGRIVTFGVHPTSPATAYGYLQAGRPLDGGGGVAELVRFVEKPDATTAETYVKAGYLWNSGNFVFAAKTLMQELDRYAPAVADAARASLPSNGADAGIVHLGEPFRTAPKISVDYAVMEKTAEATVLPVHFAWSDLGAWDAVIAAAKVDATGNAVSGQAVLLDSRDCLIRGDGPIVVGVGLDRIAIISEPDAVLVCALDHAQSVKTVVDRLRTARPDVLDLPPLEGFVVMRDRLARWLFGSGFPLWWTLGADHVHGGFHEALDDDLRPVPAPRRARVQARQIYSFATAGALGWAGPWEDAVSHGLAFFVGRYQRDDGLFRTLVTADGEPVDDTATLYDQAFAMLAFAAAAKVLPQRAAQLESLARGIVRALDATRRGARGFVEAGEHPYQANAHMHLFEAALEWEALAPDPVWSALSDQIAELCLDRFMGEDGQGPLREFFDADWRPAPGEAGRLIEPGHQFEWSWLLDRWGETRGREPARGAALRLFEFGHVGVDHKREVAINALTDELRPIDQGARLWPQTERLKAGLRLRDTAPGLRGRYDAAAASAARGLWKYLDGPTPGVWRDKMLPDGGFVDEPAPASSLYHIVCALAELRARG